MPKDEGAPSEGGLWAPVTGLLTEPPFWAVEQDPACPQAPLGELCKSLSFLCLRKWENPGTCEVPYCGHQMNDAENAQGTARQARVLCRLVLIGGWGIG